MKRVLCALVAAARFSSALPLSLFAAPHSEVEPENEVKSDEAIINHADQADQALVPQANAPRCGIRNVGVCETPADNKCATEGYEHANTFDNACDQKWCCVPLRLFKMFFADVMQEQKANGPPKIFRVIGPRVWGIKPDKAFWFEHNHDSLSIWPRKTGRLGNAVGAGGGVFLPKTIFGPNKLNLQFKIVKGGVSHDKSSGWWNKKSSPAVEVTSDEIGKLNLAGVKRLLIEAGVTTAEQLNEMNNADKAKFDEKVEDLLGTLQALPGAMIVDPSIEEDEVKPNQERALLAEVLRMFGAE